MRKNAGIILGLALFISGCGKQANLVSANQIGDSRLDCGDIELQMIQSQKSINALIPQTDKTGKNVALGVAGLIVFPAWFFMDFSKAEQQEIQSHKNRYDMLARLAHKKDCDLMM